MYFQKVLHGENIFLHPSKKSTDNQYVHIK
jgi:hypothetical protein